MTTLKEQREKLELKLARQKRIVAAYANGRGKTMREIAQGEGISHQRVNQILQAAAQDRERAA